MSEEIFFFLQIPFWVLLSKIKFKTQWRYNTLTLNYQHDIPKSRILIQTVKLIWLFAHERTSSEVRKKLSRTHAQNIRLYVYLFSDIKHTLDYNTISNQYAMIRHDSLSRAVKLIRSINHLNLFNQVKWIKPLQKRSV